MYNSSGNKGADDRSFGLSGSDGWLGGTDTGSDGWLGGTGSYNGSSFGNEGYNNSGYNNRYDNNGYDNNGNNTGFGSDDAPRPGSAEDRLRKAIAANNGAIWKAGRKTGRRNKRDAVTVYREVASVRKKPVYEPAGPGAVICFVLWLAVTAGVSFFCLKAGEYWEILFFIIQAAAGITVFCASLPKNRLKHFIIFLAADLAFAALIVILRFAMPRPFHTISVRALPVASAAALLSSAGLMIMVFSITGIMHRRQRCTFSVQGKCLDVMSRKARNDGFFSKTYCPIFEYIYNGEKYIVRPKSYKTMTPPALNSVSEMLINPDEPEEYFDIEREVRNSRRLSIAGGMWGGACALVVLGFILSAFIWP